MQCAPDHYWFFSRSEAEIEYATGVMMGGINRTLGSMRLALQIEAHMSDYIRLYPYGKQVNKILQLVAHLFGVDK